MAGFEEGGWPVDVSENPTDFTEFPPPPPTSTPLADWRLPKTWLCGTSGKIKLSLTFRALLLIATSEQGAVFLTFSASRRWVLHSQFSWREDWRFYCLSRLHSLFGSQSAFCLPALSFSSTVRLHSSDIRGWTRCRNVCKLELCARVITVVENVWRNLLNKFNKSGRTVLLPLCRITLLGCAVRKCGL